MQDLIKPLLERSQSQINLTYTPSYSPAHGIFEIFLFHFCSACHVCL